MKLFYTLLLTLFAYSTSAQDVIRVTKKPELKFITIIGYHRNLEACTYKAIRVFENDSIVIDSCYDKTTHTFTSDESGLTKGISPYMDFYRMKSSEWKSIQNKLDKIKTCDSTLPFEIHINKAQETEFFVLKRFTNCYPASVRKVMEELERYFDVKQ